MEQMMRINADDASFYLLLIQIKPPFKCVCPEENSKWFAWIIKRHHFGGL